MLNSGMNWRMPKTRLVELFVIRISEHFIFAKQIEQHHEYYDEMKKRNLDLETEVSMWSESSTNDCFRNP